MSVRFLPQQAEGFQLGGQFRTAELVVKVGIAERFAVNRAGIAAHVFGRPLDTTPDGNERTYFAAFGFIERTGPTDYCHADCLHKGRVENSAQNVSRCRQATQERNAKRGSAPSHIT